VTRIPLVAEPRRFGGTRWLFICPLVVNGRRCGRRVSALCLPPGAQRLGCRHCWRLSFARKMAKDGGK